MIYWMQPVSSCESYRLLFQKHTNSRSIEEAWAWYYSNVCVYLKKSDSVPYVLMNQVSIGYPTNGNDTFTLRWITILTYGEQLSREQLPNSGNMLYNTRCDPSQSGDARVEDWALGRHNPRLPEIHSLTKILTWNHQLPWIWRWVLKGLRPQESPLIVVRGSSLLIPHTPWHSTIISGGWFQKKKN